MADKVKRLNYFDGQFLRAKDFIDEQTYHIRMLQDHNRLLHTWGIADGLLLSADGGAMQAKVSPGVAIDSAGHEIILTDEDVTEDLTSYGGKSPLYVTIEWAEVDSDPTTEAGASGVTRKELKPNIKVSVTQPTGNTLILGTLTLDANGRVQKFDNSAALRRTAGARGGDLSVVSLTVSGLNIATDQQPRLTVAAAGRLDLQGGLKLSGDLTVAGKVAIGAQGANQKLDVADGGIGFSGVDPNAKGLNSSDKKLYSPADGDLEWMTHNLAGVHGFAVSHQGTKAVYLNTKGDSYLNGGNVGIGIATPGQKLDVSGGSVSATGSADWANGFYAKSAGGGTATLRVGPAKTYPDVPTEFGFTGTDTAIPFLIRTNGAVVTTFLTNGNVGIGTTSPVSKLDLRSGDATAPALSVGSNVSTFAAQATEGTINLGAYYTGNNTWYPAASLSGINEAASDSSFGALSFSTRNAGTISERMRITSTGNVGIGTSNPDFRLDVADRIRLREGANGSTAGLWLYQATPKEDRAFIGMANDTQVGLYGNKGAGWGLVMDVATGNVQLSGRVSDKKLRLRAFAKNKVDITSTTWVNMPDMNATFNAPIAASFQILVLINGVQSLTPNFPAVQNVASYFRLLVDNVEVDMTRHEFHQSGWELRGVFLSTLASLAAGNHTAQVQWYTTSGQTSCCWYSDTRQIQIIEL